MTKRLTNRFPSAYAKLQWAKGHIEQLETRSSAYLRERLKLTVHRDFMGQLIMTVTYQGDLPANFGLMIGDIATNLRSTLDHIIWHIVSPHLTADDREEDVSFPFPKTKDRLEKSIKKTLIDRAGPEAAAIIRNIKPYPRGDDDLWTLNKLANSDKHRILAIVSDYVQLHGVRRKEGHGREPIEFNDLKMGHGPGLVRDLHINGTGIRVGQHGNVDHEQLDMTFHIMFSEGQPFSGLSVLPTLTTLAHKVEDILAKFDEAYPSHFAPGYFEKDAWRAR
jgi:hypothetical protein